MNFPSCARIVSAGSTQLGPLSELLQPLPTVASTKFYGQLRFFDFLVDGAVDKFIRSNWLKLLAQSCRTCMQELL